MPPVEPTVSIKLLWPFVRLLGADQASARLLARYGVLAAQFADPETRLPQMAVDELLEAKLGPNRTHLTGLQAASIAEPGDVAPVIHVARTQEDVRRALAAVSRYVPLLHEGTRLEVDETDGGAVVALHFTDSRDPPPEIVGFALAMVARFVRESATRSPASARVRFRGAQPMNMGPYLELFDGYSVSFAAKTDCLVFDRAYLSTPMRGADRRARRAFGLRADRMLVELTTHGRTTARVRDLLVRHMSSHKVTMAWVAKELGTSSASLRRHLGAEGTRFSTLREETRQHHAEDRLVRSGQSVSEIAFELGFSNPAGFCRAFKRRTGLSPADYRARAREKAGRH